MPTTEVPSSPSSRPPEPPSLFRRKRARYEELEPEELLHLIDRLEDERSLARKREGIWISVIAHLVLFWFLFYGPRILGHQPHIVNPNLQKPKDMTYLALPPDALKNIKPKPNTPLSDKNRLKQNAPPPVPDRKTLNRLREMQRAPGPPAPTPPQPQRSAPQQQQAQAPPQPRRAPPPAPPIQPTQQPQLEEPKSAPTKPDFSNSQTPEEEIAQAMRDAARNRGGSSSEYGAGVPSNGQPMNAGVQVLSDTTGVDRNLLNIYIQRVIEDTRRSWYPLIPESARQPIDKQGVVGIRFKINSDGSVQDMILEFPSGDVSLDRAAWGGIRGASPYPAFPKDLSQQLKAHFLELRFGFYYNLDPYAHR